MIIVVQIISFIGFSQTSIVSAASDILQQLS